MLRVCYETATGKIIEMQSGGSTPEHLQTLLNNALNAGYSIADLTCVFMTEEDYFQLSGGPDKEAAMVTAELKVDESKVGMKTLPGWADWTALQAGTWIEDNVNNMTTVKTVLKAMAKAIIYLRDHSRITG